MTELGNRLKEARLEKGMSLDDLQAVTKIQKRYLVGIEEGNYGLMPGPFYVRAFIKQYAEAVNLELEELFEQYKADIPSTFNDDIPEKLSRVQSRKSVPGKSSKVFEILPKILIFAFVVGALALVWHFIPSATKDNPDQVVEKDDKEEIKFEQSEELKTKTEDENVQQDNEGDPAAEGAEGAENGEDAVDNEQMTQEVSVVESKGKTTVYELKNAEKFELKLVSTGETWVNIMNGSGKSLFQGTLVKGGTESQTVDFTNETEAVLVVGNTTNTEIFVNDEKVEFAASPSEYVRQDITIRYVKANQ